MELSFWTWLLALSPVLVVVIFMLAFQWGGRRAGGLGWFTAVLIALFIFGASFDLLLVAQVKSVLLSLDVLYIIWAALLIFNISREAGAIEMIGKALPGLTDDRVIQSLLIGWLMSSFLQGMGGFGVPVAVVAPLLVGLGFSAVQAVVMASIGLGWAVTFGSLGTSFQSLIAVTGLPGEYLASSSALLLGISAIPCGLLVAFIGSGWKGLKRAFLPVLLISAVMGLVQFGLVAIRLYTLGATGAAIAGLAVMFLWLKIASRKAEPDTDKNIKQIVDGKSLWMSLFAYGLLVVLVFAANLIKPVDRFLSQVTFSMNFPQVATSSDWVTPAEPGRGINIFGHPGAILVYTSIIAYVVYRMTGRIKRGALKQILHNTFKSGLDSSLGILAMVGLASIMLHSGMVYLLAEGLSVSFSRTFYPVISPFIGALGAFVTGSNNNSNVLFAVLQQNAAELLKLSVPLILAAQTTGGAIGSVLSPAKVIVGCSTVGLAGKEGVVMRKLLLYGLIVIVVVAISALILHLIS